MPDWIDIYQRLPYPLRVAAATSRGYYLKRWRYSSKTEAMVEEILERDRWPAEKMHLYQEERLAYVLHRAATQVPYYRQIWDRRRREGDRSSWEILSNWPYLHKQDVLKNPQAFVADDCDINAMFAESTSGTTGKPLILWRSKETMREWFAYFEARSRYWYGVSRHDRWGIIGGKLVAAIDQENPPFWVWNGAMNQLYLSTYHLKADNIEVYLQAIEDYGVTYLLGYPSALYPLARFAQQESLKAPQLKVVVTNAEPLYAHQREVMGNVFNCPVRETYGMAEIVAAAGECEAGNLHVWPEVGIVELLDDNDLAVPPGSPGRLVATGLINADMPLIRFETGDNMIMQPDTFQCDCGRMLPVLQNIEGRIDDMVVTPDGRHMGQLSPAISTDFHVEELQIIQDSPTILRLRFVPSENYRPANGEIIIESFRKRVGNMEITLDPVDEIPRTANGKFRAILSNIPPEDGPTEKTAA